MDLAVGVVPKRLSAIFPPVAVGIREKISLSIVSQSDEFVVRAVAQVVGDGDDAVGACSGGDDALDALGAQRERALAHDVLARGEHAQHVRLVQVKAGGEYLSAIEREQIAGLTVPANVSRECWRFPDRCKAPLIEVL